MVFSRANGSTLESWSNVPEDISFDTPLAGDVYDHSFENLEISWQSQTINNILSLNSDGCLAFDGSGYPNNTFQYDAQVVFLLESGQTSLTIPANSLLSDNNDITECEITISLYPLSYGFIDESFAGGSYTLEKQSNLRMTLTNLKATNNE